jgi:hypothetical protein
MNYAYGSSIAAQTGLSKNVDVSTGMRNPSKFSSIFQGGRNHFLMLFHGKNLITFQKLCSPIHGIHDPSL